MNKRDFVMGLVFLFLAIAIVTGSFVIGDAIRSYDTEDFIAVSTSSKVLNLSQVAQYLNIPEEEIKGIIQLEKDQSEKTGSFSGEMFPYFTINNNQYFYKDKIDEWLKEVSSTHREYNTKSGWMLQ